MDKSPPDSDLEVWALPALQLLYRFRLDGNDKVKVNNSPFPNGPLPIPNGVTGIDITCHNWQK